MKTLLLTVIALLWVAVSTAGNRPSIVFVAAHPDDTEGFAATALLLAKDYDLHVVDLTRGELGLGPRGMLDGSTERLRMAEEAAACAILGATPHFLHDVNGAAQMNRASIDALVHVFTNLQPVAVFTHWPVDIHPDHVRAAAAVAHALHLSRVKTERYFFEVALHQTRNYRPLYSVDVSSTIDRKLAVLRAYGSQNPGDELATDNLRRAEIRGAERRPAVRAAETFTTFDGEPIKGGVLERLSECEAQP